LALIGLLALIGKPSSLHGKEIDGVGSKKDPGRYQH